MPNFRTKEEIDARFWKMDTKNSLSTSLVDFGECALQLWARRKANTEAHMQPEQWRLPWANLMNDEAEPAEADPKWKRDVGSTCSVPSPRLPSRPRGEREAAERSQKKSSCYASLWQETARQRSFSPTAHTYEVYCRPGHDLY